MSVADFSTLQALLWPDANLCKDKSVWVRLTGGAQISSNGAAILFTDGGMAGFDTGFNIFSLGKWQLHAGLKHLSLALTGTGSFELTVTQIQTIGEYSKGIVARSVDLIAGHVTRIDLTDRLHSGEGGVLYLTLRAVGEAELRAVNWQTRDLPKRVPKLCLAITTFKREKAVAVSAARFVQFVAGSPNGANLHLIVIDNGKTASLPPSDKVTLVPNRNLGGAGGFARGLREAQRRGATHCLFMDDDASVQMQAVERVYALLAFATDPATAIAGGLTTAVDPCIVWENGAIFDQFCIPWFRDFDLTVQKDVVAMELASTRIMPDNFYGGFWFFAFPVSQSTRWPFPFFVRGDDISFSIANRFNIATLPGVMSFQDQDFSDKETSLTLYLDLRNHLIQHLTLPPLNKGLKRVLAIPAAFFARSMIQNHHDSLLTLNMALEDVLRGPDFFATNADMAERRAEITKARAFELWQPRTGALPAPRLWINPQSPLQKLVMKLTLNGLFLPFFGSWGNRLVLDRNARGDMRRCWGAAQVTYSDTERGMVMTVNHRKLLTLRLGLRMLANLGRFALSYPSLLAKWQAGYAKLTAADYWEGQFFADGQPVPQQPAGTEKAPAAQL